MHRQSTKKKWLSVGTATGCRYMRVAIGPTGKAAHNLKMGTVASDHGGFDPKLRFAWPLSPLYIRMERNWRSHH